MNKNDDRIYLMKIFWEGRFIIIIVPIIFILFAVFYTSQSSILWTATEKFNINKNYFLSKKVNEFRDDISIDENITNEVNYLFSDKNIDEEYYNTIKSNSNKLNFINSNYAGIFDRNIKASDINITIDEKNKDGLISIKNKDKEIINNVIYQYVKYSKFVANNNIKEKLYKILSDHKGKEVLLLSRLNQQAKIKLSIEKKKTEYSLRIAKKAGIINPIAYGNNIKFEFYSGSKALSEKIKILENIKDLSLLIPEIAFVTEDIKNLKEITIPDNLNFYKIKIELVQPITRENNKRNKLIFIISSIVGLFFGFSLVLIRSEFNK